MAEGKDKVAPGCLNSQHIAGGNTGGALMTQLDVQQTALRGMKEQAVSLPSEGSHKS